MGRPPLDIRETKVYLSPDVYDRIVALVGKYKVSSFMRDAARELLEKREAEAKQKAPPSEEGGAS